MNKTYRIIKIVVAILAVFCILKDKKFTYMNKPPIAKQVPFSYKVGQNLIEDEYFWLRDKNWPKVEDEEILNYLKAENNYADNIFFSKSKQEKEELFNEIKARIKLTDTSEEIQKGDYYYYTKTKEECDYPIYCRRFKNSAEEEIILDVNDLILNKKYVKIGAMSMSPDHTLLAYSVDYVGDERYTIKVLNVKEQKYLDDHVENVIGGIVWHQNPNQEGFFSGFFYCAADKNWRATKVFFHTLSPKNFQNKPDQLILEEKNPLYHFSISLSSSKKYLLINNGGSEENQVYTLDFFDKDLRPNLISAMRYKVLYSVEHNLDNFYILTNDISDQFRIVQTNLNDTDSKFWQEYIPADSDAYLESFDITKNYLILNYKNKALPVIKVLSLDTKEEKIIDFPEKVYTAHGYSTNFINNDIRIFYSSLKRPNTTYLYNYHQSSISPIKIMEIPSGFNPDEYEVERLWIQNEDVQIPVSVFYKKSLVFLDGSNPVYLYGYGSYGIGMEPSFRSSILSLVDRGFVFTIAHVRGGDEMGYKWYEDAKFLNKKRTFQDFICVSKGLIEKKYTSQGNIVICGGSAGGLLVGSVINLCPDLYKAAIAHVPFVDVLNTMLDSSLPLTPGEYKEWGDPAVDETFFNYIKSYSPYENVKKQHYPAIFITASINDPRVGYFEPAKWVAKLRANKLDNNLLLFKTNIDTGHQGSSGRFDYLKEVADDYLFILKTFDIKI